MTNRQLDDVSCTTVDNEMRKSSNSLQFPSKITYRMVFLFSILMRSRPKELKGHSKLPWDIFVSCFGFNNFQQFCINIPLFFVCFLKHRKLKQLNGQSWHQPNRFFFCVSMLWQGRDGGRVLGGLGVTIHLLALAQPRFSFFSYIYHFFLRLLFSLFPPSGTIPEVAERQAQEGWGVHGGQREKKRESEREPRYILQGIVGTRWWRLAS